MPMHSHSVSDKAETVQKVSSSVNHEQTWQDYASSLKVAQLV